MHNAPQRHTIDASVSNFDARRADCTVSKYNSFHSARPFDHEVGLRTGSQLDAYIQVIYSKKGTAQGNSSRQVGYATGAEYHSAIGRVTSLYIPLQSDWTRFAIKGLSDMEIVVTRRQYHARPVCTGVMNTPTA